MKVVNGAEIRPGSERQTGHGRGLGSARNHITAELDAACGDHHVHSEMWLIREGTVQLTINGTSHGMGPGSVGFVRSNDEHGIKNVGTTPANYLVVAVGPGADSQ